MQRSRVPLQPPRRFASLDGNERGRDAAGAWSTGAMNLSSHIFKESDTKDLQQLLEGRRSRKSGPLRSVPSSVNRGSHRYERLNGLDVTSRDCSKLCPACEKLFHTSHSTGWYRDDMCYLHHRDMDSLAFSASFSCALCGPVFRKVVAENIKFDMPEAEESHFGSERGLYYCFKFDKYPRFLVQVGTSFWPQTIYERIMAPEEDIQPYLTKTRPSPSTGSNSNWDLARYWLSTCRETHERCGNLRLSGFQPSRLLRVTGINGVISLQLCSTSAFFETVAYLSLSHCWGLEPIFTLTTRNISKLHKRIRIQSLPKVFRDAALVTLKLGFNYLWIDSLCIIQDSSSDWNEQSSQMGSVYKCAALNIAATGFHDGSHGLFVQRDWEQLIPPKVFANLTGKWEHGQPDRQRSGFFALVDEKSWGGSVSKAPLNRRAWVLQERLLSPCTLHFGQDQLYWECFETTKSEVFPDGSSTSMSLTDSMTLTSTLKYSSIFKGDGKNPPRFRDVQHLEDVRKQFFAWERIYAERQYDSDEADAQVPVERQFQHTLQLYASWKIIIESYSLGALTRPEDKLPAISGVAKEFMSLLDDEYLAGLWRNDLCRGLLWSVKQGSPFKFPSFYRAPSWSWASVDGEVEFLSHDWVIEHDEEVLARVIEASTASLTDDKTGQIVDGHILIKGPLVVALNLSGDSSMFGGWRVNQHEEVYLDCHADFSAQSPRAASSSSSSAAHLAHGTDGSIAVNINPSFLAKIFSQNKSFLLPILSVDPAYGPPYTAGLVLMPKPGTKGEFFRCGMFACKDERRHEIFRPGKEIIPPQFYKAHDGNGMYTIAIF